jgi:putative ABC transport system substrate-binding protein
MFNFIVTKQFALLRDVVPKADLLGLLVNPANSNTESDTADAQAAAQTLGRELIVAQASTDDELETAFATLRDRGAGALLLSSDNFLRGRIDQLAALALRDRLPMLTPWRECTKAGGLLSYGANPAEGHYQQGVYVGRILKGEKPANLPVVFPTKFEFAINLRTAKALSLSIPLSVQATADEVIE